MAWWTQTYNAQTATEAAIWTALGSGARVLPIAKRLEIELSPQRGYKEETEPPVQLSPTAIQHLTVANCTVTTIVVRMLIRVTVTQAFGQAAHLFTRMNRAKSGRTVRIVDLAPKKTSSFIVKDLIQIHSRRRQGASVAKEGPVPIGV